MTKYNFTSSEKAVAQEVVNYLERHPQRHEQGSWFEIVDGGIDAFDASKVEENLCNTTMCVAGTAMWQRYGKTGLSLLTDPKTLSLGEREAGGLLGLKEDDWRVLFYDTSNEDALTVLRRIAKGKKNIWKGTDFEE